MSRKLTAFFSATGMTRKAAEKIAEKNGTDIFEIQPVQPYTSQDLDWTNKASRSTKEMNDSACRPEIAKKAGGMADYDEIFLGFPIWWGNAPKIINTFLESYDFSGKIITPFATSGGSGYGRSSDALMASAPGAKWNKGKIVR
jgi:flavodoxin